MTPRQVGEALASSVQAGGQGAAAGGEGAVASDTAQEFDEVAYGANVGCCCGQESPPVSGSSTCPLKSSRPRPRSNMRKPSRLGGGGAPSASSSGSHHSTSVGSSK